MKKILSIIILALLTISGLWAESTGESGFKMLSVPTGAAISAMGGTGTYSADDAFVFLNNPSAALFLSGIRLSAAQNYWIFGTSLTSLSYLNSRNESSFGIVLRQLDYGKFTERDDAGTELGEFHPLDVVITANYARRLTPDHYAGISISGLYEKISSSSSLGAAVSIGYTYLPPLKGVKIGAALKNLGKTTTMNKEAIKLPLTGEISLSRNWLFNFADLSAEMKAFQCIDDNSIKAAIGLSSLFYEKFILRLGYKFNHDAEDLSAGVGFKIGKFSLDYAYLPFDYEIDDVHIIGINYLF